MNITVTGATGFVGSHLVSRLLERGHEVTAIARNRARAKTISWYSDVEFVETNLVDAIERIENVLGRTDVLIHLAWTGLPNYLSLFHIEENLWESYLFLKAAVKAGVQRIVVVGTCFEYGMQDGCLDEEMQVFPSNAYGVAKDALRRFLEQLQIDTRFDLQWCRLFYMYGSGQNPKSLIAQLEAAIARGDLKFPMSGGEQIRDYLPITEVATKLAMVAESSVLKGKINICSGKPTSVRSLVEQHVKRLGASIELDFGIYPYPTYEPFAFWETHPSF